MSAQSDYNINMREAIAGQLAEIKNYDIENGAAEGAIDFGFGVVAGTDAAKQVKLPAADSDVFRGVAGHTHKEQNSSGAARYEDTEAVNVVRKGVVWVETDDAVSIDEAATLEIATGKFSNNAAGVGFIATGGVFRSSVAAAGIAKLEINLPN